MPRATYAKMAPRSRRALIWSRILVSRALAEEGENVEHRRDVQGGTLWAGTTGSSSRRQERACSSAGVWAGARNGAQDAALRRAAELPAAAVPEAARVGAVAGRDRRHSGRRQAATQETTAHGEADF